MSHFLNVAINENGIIVDPHIDTEIKSAAKPPFKFTDVFIYSHGWWTSASDAASDYNNFSLGFAKTLQALVAATPGCLGRIRQDFSALAMACHWPSMLSEDRGAVANFLEATSFFTMEHRADDVGEHAVYSLLRMLIEARHGEPPLRFHLIGHSFGVRVLLSALETLANDSATIDLARQGQAQFSVALIQGAADAGSLVAGSMYGTVLTGIPNLNLLITTSCFDEALSAAYPHAQRLTHLFSDPVLALGSAGPTGKLAVSVSSRTVLQSGVPAPLVRGPPAVVDLSQVHGAHQADYYADHGGKKPWGGQHSNIYLPEIYGLLAQFLGNDCPASP